MIENDESGITRTIDNGLLENGQKLHLRWNSQKGRIFIDGSHLTHNLELGDEILVDNEAPPLLLFTRDDVS
jgi:NAD+ kinase